MPLTKGSFTHLFLRRSWLVTLFGVFSCVFGAYLCVRYRIAMTGAEPGFDEVHYYRLLRFGREAITGGSTVVYYAFKSLPFLLVHSLFTVGGTAGWSHLFYYRAMLLFNSACLILVAWTVVQTLIRRGLKKLIPFALVLLFYNRAFLSFYVWYPRVPDIFSLTIGSLFFMGYLNGNKQLVWASLVLAAMTDPVLTLFILICVSVWFKGPAIDFKGTTASKGNQLFWSMLFGVPVVGLGLAALYVFPDQTVAVAEGWGNPRYFKSPWVVALSVAAAVPAIWYATLPLSYWSWKSVLKSISLKHFILAFAIKAIIEAFVRSICANQTYGYNPLYTVAITESYLLSKPAPGLLSWVIFCGLIGVLVLLMWKPFSRWIAERGPGLALAFCATLTAFGLDGEVRHVLFFIPLLVIGICEVAGERFGRLPISGLIWFGLILSTNALVFFALNSFSPYGGAMMLSAFGMCWTPLHYLAAVLIVSGALVVMIKILRHYDLQLEVNGR